MIWTDSRQVAGGIYGQRLDAQGSLLWANNGIYISEYDWGHKLISDGEGMVIEQYQVEENNYNVHKRINRNGQILWTRDHLSYWNEGITLGEPGYFYLGSRYEFTENVIGQRVDLNGNPHWGGNGAIFYSRPGWAYHTGAWTYNYPYFYFLGGVIPIANDRRRLIVQMLDSSGTRLLGDYGIELTGNEIPGGEGGYYYLNVIPTEGDIVAVYELLIGHPGSDVYDILAKRCHADGTLGGPFPMGVTVTPHNPPIQIPAQGGSFTFDIAVADTDTVGGPFDAWIEVILPENRTHQNTARRHLNMRTGGTISKPNLTQVVPAYAPPGVYTYRVCAGDDSFKIPWGEGSFTFEKLVEVDATSSRSPSRPRLGRLGWDSPDSSGWVLQGDFFKEGVEVEAHGLPLRGMRPSGSGADQQGVQLSKGTPMENAPTQPADLQLNARPNPFNPDIDISFTLSNAQHIEIAIYDLRGNKVETIADGVLPPGLHTYNWNGDRHSAGIYFVRLSTENQNVVKKVILLR